MSSYKIHFLLYINFKIYTPSPLETGIFVCPPSAWFHGPIFLWDQRKPHGRVSVWSCGETTALNIINSSAGSLWVSALLHHSAACLVSLRVPFIKSWFHRHPNILCTHFPFEKDQNSILKIHIFSTWNVLLFDK